MRKEGIEDLRSELHYNYLAIAINSLQNVKNMRRNVYMIYVLHVIHSMGCGGAEALIMNLYRNIDRKKLQFDFVVQEDRKQFYDAEIYSLGGKIYHAPNFGVRMVFAYKKWWEKFFQNHPEYKIVHGHIGSTAAIYLLEAKKSGAVIIAHSHGEMPNKITPRNLAWRFFSYPTRYIADFFFACSEKAAVTRYGKRVASSPRCRTLKNSIDCDRFRFRSDQRDHSRKELRIGGSFVVGHVGRFVEEKNHMFLLEVFCKVIERLPNAVLLLLGSGELEDEIREKSRVLGISNAVIFAGVHQNVEEYYAAMDVFCFPSLYEGFGNVVVEAQTNGLPCVVSTAVPADLADMGAGLFVSMDLSASPKEWADTLIQFKGKAHDESAWRKTVEHGFDSKETARNLQEYYFAIMKLLGLSIDELI